MKGSACYYRSMDNEAWSNGLGPNQKIAQLSEITLRLARISLYRRLQQAESQLNTMGVPNQIGEIFRKTSADMLKDGFKKPEFRCIQVNTTPDSVF